MSSAARRGRRCSSSPGTTCRSRSSRPPAPPYVLGGKRSTYDPPGASLIKLGADPVPFVRGRINADRELDLADVIALLSFLFGAPENNPWKQRVAQCMDAADANDDGAVDLADAIHLLAFLFAHGAPAPASFDACSRDPTPDRLRCASFEGCGP